jgi:hypothetical protein
VESGAIVDITPIVVFVVCSYDIMFFKTLEKFIEREFSRRRFIFDAEIDSDDGQYYS